jgi:hypothetical protein
MAIYNDNLDGTLSQVGSYGTRNSSNKGSPALIVSQYPVAQDAPPIASPTIYQPVTAAKEPDPQQRPQPVSCNAEGFPRLC